MRAIAGKSLKYSLILLAVVVVVLLAAPFFIDVNDYRPRLVQVAEDATGRKVQIGAIHASLFPWVGVSLEDISLANREGFSERAFLTAESVHIKLALLPLFSKRIEIKHFELNKPVLFLEKNTTGETNWADLLPAKTVPAGKKATGPSATANQLSAAAPSVPFAFQAESVRLRDGTLIWTDAQHGNEISLTRLQLEVNDVHLDRPVAVQLSGELGGDAFALDARVGPIGELSKLDVLALPIQVHLQAGHVSMAQFRAYASAWPAALGEIDDAYMGMDVQLEQRPDGIRLAEGEVHLQALRRFSAVWKLDMPKPNHINVRHMTVSVDGQDILSAQGDVRHLNREPAYNLRINSNSISRQWLVGMVPDIGAMYAAHPAPWEHIRFAALVSGDAGRMDIRDLQLRLNGELIQVSGSVGFARTNSLRLRVAAKKLHMDPWLPQPVQQPAIAATSRPGARINAAEQMPVSTSGSGKKGPARIQPAATGIREPDLRFLKAWRVSTQFQADHIYMRGLDMQHMRLNLNGANGRFVVDPLRFTLAGGQVREQASLNAAAYPARWTESVHVTNVRVGPVLKALVNADILDGTLQMDTKLKARGLLPDTALKSLSGRGNIMLRNGRIKGFNIAATLRKLSNPLAASGPRETDFAQLSGSFVIKRGIARNDDLFIASPVLRVTGRGEVDLVKKQLDYHIKPTMTASLPGVGGGKIAVRKGLSVPLHIRGPLDAPRISPEISASTILENIGGIAGSAAEGTGKAAKGVGTGVEGVLGGGKKPADDQQQAPAPEEPPVRKILKGLIPGL